MTKNKNTEEVFWQNVEKTETCWNWNGRLDKDGYGLWWFNGKNIRAHRYSAKSETKDIARHLCHNPKCVNPEHIVNGTQQENIEDQLRNGTHSKLKYSELVVEKIRQEYALGDTSTRKLALKYGLSKSQVHAIVKLKTRKIMVQLNNEY